MRKKISTPPPGRLGVYTHDLVYLAHVGPSATEATASRFLKRRGATLQTVAGRKAWVGPKPEVLGAFSSKRP